MGFTSSPECGEQSPPEVLDALPCSPDASKNEELLCIPADGKPCGYCCEECINSQAGKDAVERVYGEALCLRWETSDVCGPALVDDQCCYVVSISACLNGDP